MFRIKPKKSGKKGNTTRTTTVDSLKCEFAECGIDNVDLIKCNAMSVKSEFATMF